MQMPLLSLPNAAVARWNNPWFANAHRIVVQRKREDEEVIFDRKEPVVESLEDNEIEMEG